MEEKLLFEFVRGPLVFQIGLLSYVEIQTLSNEYLNSQMLYVKLKVCLLYCIFSPASTYDNILSELHSIALLYSVLPRQGFG